MDEKNNLNLGAGVILTLLVGYWFWKVVLVPHTAFEPPWIFLDYANLIFHEAGHFIFMFFGQFLHVLGGSLMQLLVPAVAIFAFWQQEEKFGIGFATFWLGESLSNLSFYIGDARAQTLPLLGGDPSGHDWTWLLGTMNLLESDTVISRGLYAIAVLTMLAGLGFMLWTLYKKYLDNY